jgi:WD40 repeat protein
MQVRNYILRIYFEPTLFQRFSLSTTVKWGATYMGSDVQKSTYAHDAFVSYSRKDKEFARRLEKALEDYKPPKDLKVPQRNLNIFRDEEGFTGVEYQHSLSPGDRVRMVAFSKNGKLLATAGNDKTARVWEVSSGQEVTRVKHEGAVYAVAFGPDDKYLATASSDNTDRVSLLRPKDLITEACSRLTRNLTREEWKRYLGNGPYRPTCPNWPTQEK